MLYSLKVPWMIKNNVVGSNTDMAKNRTFWIINCG